ncbi:hypothetical protein [Ramlibacter lithotrophicus]|uniref:hypothetical protein n=1 Tax=Ramlibacter lithotrophicus TaxID=2606681 RepID=UPI0014386DC5|nr:hypothetical protein [Ramlibacter lithotrophicus]
MSTRKDFSQVALDVVRRATREDEPPKPEPKTKKQTAPKAKTKGAVKKAGKKG